MTLQLLKDQQKSLKGSKDTDWTQDKLYLSQMQDPRDAAELRKAKQGLVPLLSSRSASPASPGSTQRHEEAAEEETKEPRQANGAGKSRLK